MINRFMRKEGETKYDYNKMSEIDFTNHIEKAFGVPVLSEYRDDLKFYPEDGVGVTVKWGAHVDDVSEHKSNDCEVSEHKVNDCCILRFTSEKTGVRYCCLILSGKESGSRYKMNVLHELGHYFCDKGREVIAQEIDAWNWAEAVAKSLEIKYERSQIKSMLATYIIKYNTTCKNKVRAFFVRDDKNKTK